MLTIRRLRNCLMVVCTAFTLLCCTMPATVAAAIPEEQTVPHLPPKKAAVVIDDFGNQMQGTDEMLQLPFPITAAVMPFLPTTKQDAEAAHARGLDVIVHLPMEPNKGKRSWLGPGAITTDLPDEEIRNRVVAAVEDVPYAIGMNNHMGSKATADLRVMRIVLQVCKEKGIFFLDSRTSPKSVVGKLCAEMGVPTASNALFLDEVYTYKHINKQLQHFKKYMAKHETCIMIGHVGPPGLKTAHALKETMPRLADVEVVPLRTLVHEVSPPRQPASGSGSR